MPQHDFDIANQTFPNTRADINNALEALATNSEGTTAPSTTYAYQWWYDTTNDILKMRNGANDGWINVLEFDQTADTVASRNGVGSESAPSYTFDNDTNTGFFRPAADVVAISTGGGERVRVNSSGFLVGTDSFTGVFDGSSVNPGAALESSGSVTSQVNGGVNLLLSKATGFSDGRYALFYDANSTVGGISRTGSGVSFDTTSDPRAKENIRDLDVNAGEVIDSFRPRAFKMKDNGFETWGFLTTEYPIKDAVSGEEGAVDGNGNPIMQRLDASTPAAMAIIIAELQSLRQRVAELEAGNA